MRRFWDARARENALFYIHSELDFTDPDEDEFWRSGEDNLDRTLAPFGVRLAPTDVVVEIGCGIGRITRAIAGRAARVTGLDVSSEMIDRGRRALAAVPNADLRVGDGRSLAGIGDSSVDVVYSFIVFQHIPDPAVTCGYIREIGRVLKPGGWTVFQISEQPDVHRAETYKRGTPPRRWFRRATPRGCLEPPWLGSALPRSDLLAALAAGGVHLEGTVGDGTQFCLVYGRARPR